MKKLLFIFMLIGSVSQLKAQNRFQLQPFNKLPENFYKKESKLPDSLTRFIPQTPNVVINGTKLDVNRQYAYNAMPVVRMEGRSNMPVVKIEGNSRMPVINPDAGSNIVVPKPLP